MSEKEIETATQSIDKLLEQMNLVQKDGDFALSSNTSEKWEAAKKELADAAEVIKNTEIKDIADAGKLVAAAKAHIQAVINSQPNPSPELEAKLKEISSLTVTAEGDVKNAVAVAATTEQTASAAEGTEFFKDTMSAIGTGVSMVATAASIPISEALKGFPKLSEFMKSDQINKALEEMGTGMKTLLAEAANLKPESTGRMTQKEGEGPGSALVNAGKNVSQTIGI